MARVLIIDDDLMVSRVLQEHLSDEGYQVEAAYMAEEGFAKAVQSPPDLILLDVQMPDATGFQIVGRFRENPVTHEIPIIMMTGAARWPNQQAIGRRMGANDYVLKPFDVIDVGNRVHRLMGSKRPLQKQKFKPEPPIPEIPGIPVKFLGDPVEMDPPPVQVAPLPPPAPTPVVQPLPPVEIKAEIVIPKVENKPQSELQRFLDFSLGILIFVSRLPKTRAGRHMSDQLLRTGTAIGAKMQEAQWTESEEEKKLLRRAALKDLRETGYWLMMTTKANLLETASLKTLEQTCQDLIAVLADTKTSSPQDAAIEKL